MATTGIYDDDYPDSASSVADDESERAPAGSNFERRTHTRETFKQNTTMSPAEAKAKEAAEQQARFGRGRGEAAAPNRERPASRASSAASSSILTPSSARARSPAREASEQTPLLDTDQPPPSYSDATAGRAYRPEQRPEQRPMVGSYGSIPASARAEAIRGVEEGRRASAAARREAEQSIEEGRQAAAAGRREAERGIEEGRQAAAAARREAHAATGHVDNGDFYWPFGNRGNPFKHNPPWAYRGPFVPPGMWGGEGADETGRESMSDPHRDHRGRGRGHGRWHGRRWDRGRWRQWREWHDHDEESNSNSSRELRKNARNCTGKRRWRERCCMPRHVCNWILAGLIIFLIIMIGWIAKGETEKSNPKTPSSPSNEPFPRDAYLQHPSTNQCQFVHSSALFIESFSFGHKQTPNFTLLEMMEFSPSGDFSNGIGGTISITPAPSEQTEDIVVVIHMATTASWKIDKPDLVISGSAMEIRQPFYSHIDGEAASGACLDVAVKVAVRKDVILSNFEVAALNLDVACAGSLFKHGETEDWDGGLTIKNTTDISTVQGHVHLAYWASRETYISTISGSVQGTYALKDVLSIGTKSGSVDISVSPHHVDEDHPKPAELKIDTLSGSVKTHWVTMHGIPHRDYRCTVAAKSSSIQGSYMLGSSTNLTTLSGHITADILPYDAGQKRAQLRTSSHSGSTDVNVLDPDQFDHFPHFWKDYASTSVKAFKIGILSRLISSHESNSGSLMLLYPQDWLGTFSGHTLSGSVKIRGKDVETDLDAHLPVGSYFEGRKGIGNSKLKFSTTSGSVHLVIGEL